MLSTRTRLRSSLSFLQIELTEDERREEVALFPNDPRQKVQPANVCLKLTSAPPQGHMHICES